MGCRARRRQATLQRLQSQVGCAPDRAHRCQAAFLDAVDAREAAGCSSDGRNRKRGGHEVPRMLSHTLTQGATRAAARAMFKANGFTDDDLRKPLVGIANTWVETMPCGYHLRELAERVKEGVREAGGTPMEFNTIAISDGITMGTAGMKGSLVSREVIADSIELVADSHMFDAMVCVVGCDKTTPAAAMALARLDVPGVVVYSGTIAPGHFRGQTVAVG